MQPHAGVFGAEVTGAVSPFAAAAVAGRRAEHDILRQILIQRTKPITDPGANGRKGAFARMPARVPGELRAVVVVDGPEGPDDSEVVGTGSDVFPPVSNFQTALAVFA